MFLYFFKTGKKIVVVVVLFEFFSEMFYPNNSLHFGISPLLSVSFVHSENTLKEHFREKNKKAEKQRRKRMSTKSLSQSSQVYHPKVCI